MKNNGLSKLDTYQRRKTFMKNDEKIVISLVIIEYLMDGILN